MMRSLPVLVLGIMMIVPLLLSPSSHAQERKLTAIEIKEVLTGRTIKGVSGGTSYRQTFNADGSWVYKANRIYRGTWYVDEETDQYCGKGQRLRCWDVYQDGQELIWVDGDERTVSGFVD